MAHDNEYKDTQKHLDDDGAEHLRHDSTSEQSDLLKNETDSNNTEITPEQADEIQSSAVEATLGRRAENYSSGATHNDTGIFPQP